ncbi:hypothetical protein CCP1ISM_110014 [Azospirillaceae bacterium]
MIGFVVVMGRVIYPFGKVRQAQNVAEWHEFAKPANLSLHDREGKGIEGYFSFIINRLSNRQFEIEATTGSVG